MKIQPPTILSTTDYDAFHLIEGNRPINHSFVSNLISSLEEKNFLPETPLKVTKDFGIADGQHRFLAAKALGLPVYYIITDINLGQVALINSNSRPWITTDYLESFVKQGKKEYIALKEFATEYRISPSIAIRICSGTGLAEVPTMKKFRAGKFVIEDYERAENLASLLSEIRKYTPDMAWSHRYCIRALDILIDKINPQELIKQLTQYNQVVTRRLSTKDYLMEFENILNANRKEKPVKLL